MTERSQSPRYPLQYYRQTHQRKCALRGAGGERPVVCQDGRAQEKTKRRVRRCRRVRRAERGGGGCPRVARVLAILESETLTDASGDDSSSLALSPMLVGGVGGGWRLLFCDLFSGAAMGSENQTGRLVPGLDRCRGCESFPCVVSVIVRVAAASEHGAIIAHRTRSMYQSTAEVEAVCGVAMCGLL